MADKKIGRPSKLTPQVCDEICQAISTSSKSLEQLCSENPHWPTRKFILQKRIFDETFGNAYARAKQEQVEVFIDEITQIADDSSRDVITKIGHDGEEYEVCNTEFIARSRLRIDTRKWIACKLAPKLYGDKTETTHHITIEDSTRKVLEIEDKHKKEY